LRVVCNQLMSKNSAVYLSFLMVYGSCLLLARSLARSNAGMTRSIQKPHTTQNERYAVLASVCKKLLASYVVT
jgi:hypothetical protein